jgi:hypothetical protein
MLKLYQADTKKGKKMSSWSNKERRVNISLSKNNSKAISSRNCNRRKKQIENNITVILNGLIMQGNSMRKNPEVESPPRINTNSNLFTLQEVENGIKKPKTGKAKDLVEI